MIVVHGLRQLTEVVPAVRHLGRREPGRPRLIVAALLLLFFPFFSLVFALCLS